MTKGGIQCYGPPHCRAIPSAGALRQHRGHSTQLQGLFFVYARVARILVNIGRGIPTVVPNVPWDSRATGVPPNI